MGDVRLHKNARTTAPPAAEIDAVQDEILELVFLRLPSAVQLVRAASTCRRWRRIITADGGRLIRSLHGAPSTHVAGHYRVDHRLLFSRSRPPGRNPVFVPSPSTSPWGDILTARNLALGFLPRPEMRGSCWELADTRGGLLLLALLNEKKDPTTVSRLVVCDPMTREYRAIPPSPWFHRCSFLGAFLLDGEDGAGEGISLSNFRATSVHYRIKDAIGRACSYRPEAVGDRDEIARACTFSSAGGGRWTSFAARASTAIYDNDYWGWDCQVSFAGFGAGGSVAYWSAGNRGVLCLDKDGAELYILPDMPQDELRAPEYAYQLPWPPTIQAALEMSTTSPESS